jgi:hypothetical protein
MRGNPSVTILACLPLLAGCDSGPPLANPPPCATLAVDSGCGLVQGQCLWVNGRALTAAHLFTGCGDVSVPLDVVLDGRNGAIAGFRAGAPGPFGPDNLFMNGTPALSEDWAAFATEIAHAGECRMRLGDGRVEPGERLYLVGYDPQDDFQRLVAVPLTVVRATDEGGTPLSERLIPTLGPPGRRLSGFSGGFVGRFDQVRAEWEYVGVFVATSRDPSTERSSAQSPLRRKRAIHMVVRPPEEVLVWLLETNADDASASPDDAGTSLTAGYAYLPPGWAPSGSATFRLPLDDGGYVNVRACLATNPEIPGCVYFKLGSCDPHGDWQLIRADAPGADGAPHAPTSASATPAPPPPAAPR